MSESSYTGKEGKRMKDSEDVQQEDEEKAKEVSKEGNALSSSTPTETATDAEGSDKMNVEPSGEEINVDLPSKKPEDSLMTHDDAISESRLGGSSEKANQEELQDTAATSTKVGELKRGKFLFELQLSPNDVEQRNLFIPAEETAGYFPTGTPENSPIEKIKISNTRNQDWYMRLLYFPLDDTFMLSNGWQDFVDRHNVETRDVIRFYRPVPPSHDNHFLIECVKREEAQTRNIPEFKQENFLFDLQLSPDESTYGLLIVPREEVRNHFPVIQMPAAFPKLERLKFTDAQNKDWWMTLIYHGEVDGYLIAKGWEGFVKDHNLEAMDVIKFYKPTRPSHTRHFLINYVKKVEAGTNLPQSASVTNGGNQLHDSCHSGGPNNGGCHKGKEVAVGHEKPALGGPGQSCHDPENGSNGD